VRTALSPLCSPLPSHSDCRCCHSHCPHHAAASFAANPYNRQTNTPTTTRTSMNMHQHRVRSAPCVRIAMDVRCIRVPPLPSTSADRQRILIVTMIPFMRFMCWRDEHFTDMCMCLMHRPRAMMHTSRGRRYEDRRDMAEMQQRPHALISQFSVSSKRGRMPPPPSAAAHRSDRSPCGQ
jgi:hypothetical protein